MHAFLRAFGSRASALNALNFLIGALSCATLAVMVCLLMPAHAQLAAVPMVFILVVVAMSMRFGAGAGVLGCLLSALIFALFLFKPAGGVAFHNSSANNNLFCMILWGVPGSYLFAPLDAAPARADKDSR